MDSTPFYVALYIHLFGLILAFGSVIVTDLFGLLWIFNRVRFPQVIRVSGETENFIWTGWGIMVVAGLALIYYKGAIDNLMVIKLFFVGLIGLNGIPLHFLQKAVKGYDVGLEIPNIVMFRLGLCLFISQLGWWGAFTIGFLHRHVQPIIEWPPHPILVCAGILVCLLTLWGIGETTLKVSGIAEE